MKTLSSFAVAALALSSAIGCGHTQDEWDAQLAENNRLLAEHEALVARREKLEAELTKIAPVSTDAKASSAKPSPTSPSPSPEPVTIATATSTTAAQPEPTVASAAAGGSLPPRTTPWPDLAAALRTSDIAAGDAALVVAIEDYIFLSDVPGAVRNGEDWFRFLTKTRNVPLAQVRLLFNGEATDYAIRTSLAELADQVQPGGKLWFVFIGHGAPSERDKDGLLVTVDAQQTVAGVEQRSVRQRELFSLLNRSKGTPVVILDACYSGRTPNGATLVAGLQPTTVVSPRVPRGALVLSAAASNEFAGPLPGDERPAFSYLALGGLRGWADDDGDGRVTGQEIATYVKTTLRVLLSASRQQTPQALGSPDLVLSHGREQGPELGDLLLSLKRRSNPR